MGCAIIAGRLQRNDDIAVNSQRQSSLCKGWSRDVSAQALKLLASIRLASDTGM